MPDRIGTQERLSDACIAAAKELDRDENKQLDLADVADVIYKHVRLALQPEE